MSTSAKIGYGVLLKVGNGATPEVFTAIAELTNISGPGLTLDAVEATHTESPNAYREYIAGLLDGGEISLEVNFLPGNATHAIATGILGDHQNRTMRNFQVVWPDGSSTTWSFAALVTKAEPTAPLDNRMTMALTLKISGKPTLA